jgi:hypothetical protein
VVAKAPQTIAGLLEEARIAEITATPTSNDIILTTVQRLEEEVKRIGKRSERATTSSISATGTRSPTPEGRRVSFSSARPMTPPGGDRPRGQYGPNSGNAYRGRGYVRGGRYQQREGIPAPAGNRGQTFNDRCTRCGYTSHARGGPCPALRPGHTCARCRRPGHYAQACRSSTQGRPAQSQ